MKNVAHRVTSQWRRDILFALKKILGGFQKGRLEARVYGGGWFADELSQVVEEPSGGRVVKKEFWLAEEYKEGCLPAYKAQYAASLERHARVGLDWFEIVGSYCLDRPSDGCLTLHEFVSCSELGVELDHLVKRLQDRLVVCCPGEEMARVLLGQVVRN